MTRDYELIGTHGTRKGHTGRVRTYDADFAEALAAEVAELGEVRCHGRSGRCLEGAEG